MLAAPALAVRSSRIEGRGVYALGPIRRGARIIEYTGRRIDDARAAALYEDPAAVRHLTYLFQVRRGVVIDGADGGNAARFINHSCNPNCETLIVGDRVFIRAKRAISSGDELTFDYWFERDGSEDAEVERAYACRCGTSRCRGSMFAPRRRPRDSRRTTA